MGHVFGPFGQFYIATYACALGKRSFIGYAKVCGQRPRSYWDAEGLAKFAGETVWPSEGEAVREALGIARDQLANRGLVFRGTASQ